MIKKIPVLVLIALFLFPSYTKAQASFRCYTSPKNKHQWIIGLRTGLSKEYHNSFYSSRDGSRLLSWSQQLFLQRVLSEHFRLELQMMHQNSRHDLTGFVGYPGASQVQASSYNERLHSNLLLHYIFQGLNKGTLSIAGGLGLIGSREDYEDAYEKNGQTFEHKNRQYSLGGPNFVAAFTYSIPLKKNLELDAQFSYSNVFTNPSVSHLNLNIGFGYLL